MNPYDNNKAINSNQSGPHISVVIPVFNESESIRQVVEELQHLLSKCHWHYEIIIVDDGSDDGTLEIIQNMQQQYHPLIHLVSFGLRSGKASAQQAGIHKTTGTFTVFMDGDGQDDPEEIPCLIDIMENESPGMIVGRRVNRESDRYYITASAFFNLIISMITGICIRDINASMKVTRTELLKKISIYSGNYRFLPLLLHFRGIKVIEKDVTHRKRLAGYSKYSPSKIVDGFWDMITVIFLIRNHNNPLHFFGGLSLCLGIPGLIICFYITLIRLSYGNIQNHYPLLLLGILLILSATQLFCAGLLAELMVHLKYDKRDKQP